MDKKLFLQIYGYFPTIKSSNENKLDFQMPVLKSLGK